MARIDIVGGDMQETLDKLNDSLEQSGIVHKVGAYIDPDGKLSYVYYKIDEYDDRMFRVPLMPIDGRYMFIDVFQGNDVVMDPSQTVSWQFRVAQLDGNALGFYAIIDTDLVCFPGMAIIKMKHLSDNNKTKVKLFVSSANQVNPNEYGELLYKNQNDYPKTLSKQFQIDINKDKPIFCLYYLITQDAYYTDKVYTGIYGRWQYQFSPGSKYRFTDIKQKQSYTVKFIGIGFVGGY